jgi:valyl-tRNA synthetase
MAAMDDALDIVSGIRGLKKTYELGWRVEPKVIIEISSSQSREELSPLLDTIKTLAQSGSIVVTDKPRDDHQSNMSFWTSTTVGDGKYRVLMDVQGLLNLEKVFVHF